MTAEFLTESTRHHAEELATGIAGILGGPEPEQQRCPQAVIVGVGPGPFTGLRAGIATARMLSFTWQVPLYGVMSLDALGWAAVTGPENIRPRAEFLVATDARRSEVYWARYDAEGTLLEGPSVGSARELPPDLPVYGAGAGRYAEELSERVIPEFAEAQPRAAELAALAARRLDHGESLLDSTPLYLRESDAKIPGPRKRAL